MPPLYLRLAVALFALLLRPLSASAMLVNFTIDDTNGDPDSGTFVTYEPLGAWNAGQDCTDCVARPNASKIFMGSWHDGTFVPESHIAGVPLTASVAFNGSAIYAFCIIPEAAFDFFGNTALTFLLDGVPSGTFTLDPPTTRNAFAYRVPVYANESLTPGPHKFTLVNGRSDGPPSIMLLDYIIYTKDIPDNGTGTESPGAQESVIMTVTATATLPSSSQTSSTSSGLSPHVRMVAILVSTIGGAFFIAFLAALFVFLRRRHSYSVCARNEPPTPIDGGADPGASGWAQGTWEGAADGAAAAVRSQEEDGFRRGMFSWRSGSGQRTEEDRKARRAELPAARGTTEGGSFILPLARRAALEAPGLSASLTLVVQSPSLPPPSQSQSQASARPSRAASPPTPRIPTTPPLQLHLPTTGGSIFVESDMQTLASAELRALIDSTRDLAQSLIERPQSPHTVYLPARADSVKTLVGPHAHAKSGPLDAPPLPPLPLLAGPADGGVQGSCALPTKEGEVKQDRVTTEKVRCRQLARFFTIGAECPWAAQQP